MIRVIEIEDCVNCKYFVGGVWEGEREGKCLISNMRIGKDTSFLGGFPRWCPLEIKED